MINVGYLKEKCIAAYNLNRTSILYNFLTTFRKSYSQLFLKTSFGNVIKSEISVEIYS